MKILFILLLSLVLVYQADAQYSGVLSDKLLKRAQIPELAYLVMDKNNELEHGMYGAHLYGSTHIVDKSNSNDYFHLGSNTKAITAYIAGYMVERKQIKWGTRFFDLLKEYKKSSNPAYFRMTLADLLSHRSHLPSFTSGSEFEMLPAFNGDRQTKRREFSRFVLNMKPIFNTKESYFYSNAGYTLAVQMLEKASGKSWEMLVDDLLGKQLKLSYRFGWPNRTDKRQPWGHWEEDGRIVPIPGDTNYTLNMIEPAGDISMTLSSYSSFIQMILKGLSRGDKLLSKQAYNYLLFGRKDYAMGWVNFYSKNKKFAEHTGSAGTFYAYAIIDPKRMQSIIILANSGTDKAENFVHSLAGKLKSKYGFNN